MLKIGLIKKLLVAFIVTASMLTGVNAAKKEQKYIIATASTGGTYYPVGIGIATIASLKLAYKEKIIFSAITSAGSAENIDMLEKVQTPYQEKQKYERQPKRY